MNRNRLARLLKVSTAKVKAVFITAHRFHSCTEACEASASGYLVKRCVGEGLATGRALEVKRQFYSTPLVTEK